MFDTRVQPPHPTAALNLGDAERPVWVRTGSHGDTQGHSFPADQQSRWLEAFIQAGYSPIWGAVNKPSPRPLQEVIDLFYECRAIEDRHKQKEQPLVDQQRPAITRIHGNVAVEIDPYRLTEDLPHWFTLAGSSFAIVREVDGTFRLYSSGNPIHVQDLRAKERAEFDKYVRGDRSPTATEAAPEPTLVPVDAVGEVGTYLTPTEWFQIRENVLHHLWTPSVEVVRLLLAEYDALLKFTAKVKDPPAALPVTSQDGPIRDDEWRTIRDQVASGEMQWFNRYLVGRLIHEYDALWVKWKAATERLLRNGLE